MEKQPLQYDMVKDLSVYLETYESVPDVFKSQYGKDNFLVRPQGLGSEVIRMLGEIWDFRIGQKTDNDLVIDDRIISRHHAVIHYENGMTYLEDLGSRNGTFLDGKKVCSLDSVALRLGGHIVLGMKKEEADHQWLFYDCEGFMDYLELLKKSQASTPEGISCKL